MSKITHKHLRVNMKKVNKKDLKDILILSLKIIFKICIIIFLIYLLVNL